jgi:hypothetical protein
MPQSFGDFFRNRFNINDDADGDPADAAFDDLEEARRILGVGRGATEDEIQAAFRRRARETHPDRARGNDTAAFRAAVEARDRLLREARRSSRSRASDAGDDSGAYRSGPLAEAPNQGDDDRPGDDGRGTRAGGPDRFSPLHPLTVVRTYLEWRNIRILYNGKLLFADAPRCAKTRADINAYLDVEPLDDIRVVDDLLFECKEAGIPLTKSDAQAAIREEKAVAKQARTREIINNLLRPLTKAEAEEVEHQWSRLETVFFGMPAGLAVVCLKNFMHNVLSKALGRDVENHLAPVIFSAEQATGKTTFAKRLLAPLKELRSASTPLSDIADPRSMQIFSYLVVLVDDAGEISKKAVATLKNIITDNEGTRRRLGTSGAVTFDQRATLLMTSNRDVSLLVPDETGHRRFVMMPFRNGNPNKGGDPEIWATLDSIDFELLWRSVDPFEPAPIVPHLKKLAEHQGVGRPDELKAWLLNLDVNSEEVKQITRRTGVSAHGLYQLFCSQTGSTMSATKFGTELKRHIADPNVPFGVQDDDRIGRVYPIKKIPKAA